MNHEKKGLRKCLAVLLILAMTITSSYVMPNQVNAQTQNQTSMETTYKGEGYEVCYKLTGSWDGAFNANVTISNTSDAVIDNWTIAFQLPYEITNIWNGNIVSSDDGKYIIKNTGSNQDIAVGGSVDFGFSANCSTEIELPDTYELLCFEEELTSDQVSIESKVLNDWGQGFNGEISIKNISDQTIEDWKLEFDFDYTISNFWTAEIISHDGNHYYIKNAGYNANIKPGETLTLGFGANPGNVTSGITNTKATQITSNKKEVKPDPVETVADLKASKNEISTDTDDGQVYFYLDMADETSENIVLCENDDQVTSFYDDGDFTNHGDDIKGDGIYSAKYMIDTKITNDVENSYVAMIGQDEVSNTIKIPVYIGLSDQEIDDMDYVDQKISSVLKEHLTPDYLINVPSDYVQNGSETEEYNEIVEQRYQALLEVVTELKSQGYIGEYSLDELNGVLNCSYSNGIWFGVMLDDPLQANDIEETDYLSTYAEENKEYSGYNALILNSFENSSYRTKYYEKLEKKWSDKGLDVDYQDFVRAQDLKTSLDDKDIITFSGHGTVVNTQSVFCLGDDSASKTQDKLYSTDMRTGRIMKLSYTDGTSSYVVTGDFFTHYYGSDGLDGSFIFSECCNFMGSEKEAGLNMDFANDLVGCSAEAVIGFYNSVMADYSRELMAYYCEQLLEGSTAAEAFNAARNEYGMNDFEYRAPSFFDWLLDRHAFDKMEPTAFPLLVGDSDSSLAKELQNGDWELSGQKNTSKPLKWNYSGDARVLKNLGPIQAKGSRMVFLSTGIGSQSGVGLSGTQGSTLTQAVRNDDKTKLEFTYDVISEEPMEYVGSQYDDKFEIQILDANNNILYNDILETINKSDWTKISDINFDGGDSTVYHTTWKTESIDISSYQDQIIKIRFLTYDIGDSAYDTAVVIDDINMY